MTCNWLMVVDSAGSGRGVAGSVAYGSTRLEFQQQLSSSIDSAEDSHNQLKRFVLLVALIHLQLQRTFCNVCTDKTGHASAPCRNQMALGAMSSMCGIHSLSCLCPLLFLQVLVLHCLHSTVRAQQQLPKPGRRCGAVLLHPEVLRHGSHHLLGSWTCV